MTLQQNVCHSDRLSSEVAAQHAFCKRLISLCKMDAEQGWLSNMLSGGGAAEQRSQAIEASRQFRAEQDWLSSVARTHKRCGLLRSLPAAPPSRDDGLKTQASDVCQRDGRRSDIPVRDARHLFFRRAPFAKLRRSAVLIGKPYRTMSTECL
jgi:hypothetical protein